MLTGDDFKTGLGDVMTKKAGSRTGRYVKSHRDTNISAINKLMRCKIILL